MGQITHVATYYFGTSLSHLSSQPLRCLRTALKYLSSLFITFCSYHSISGFCHVYIAIKNHEIVCILVQKNVHDSNFDYIYINCDRILRIWDLNAAYIYPAIRITKISESLSLRCSYFFKHAFFN